MILPVVVLGSCFVLACPVILWKTRNHPDRFLRESTRVFMPLFFLGGLLTIWGGVLWGGSPTNMPSAAALAWMQENVDPLLEKQEAAFKRCERAKSEFDLANEELKAVNVELDAKERELHQRFGSVLPKYDDQKKSPLR